MITRRPYARSSLAAVALAALAGIAAAQEPASTPAARAPSPAVQTPAPAVEAPQLPSLDELSETRERPLFARTRRPPAIAPPTVEKAAPQVVAREEAPAELTGIVIGPEKTYAILKSRVTKEVQHLHRGDRIDDWTIDEIGPRHVLLHRDETRIRVELFEQKSSDASVPTAPILTQQTRPRRRPPPAARDPNDFRSSPAQRRRPAPQRQPSRNL